MEFLTDIKNSALQEVVLLLLMILNIFFAIFVKKNFHRTYRFIACIGILLVIFAGTYVQISPNYFAFNNSFLSNVYTISFKTMILISVFCIILISGTIIKKKKHNAFEYYCLLFSATIGAFSLISSNDFITAFISLETMSISCYLLTAFDKTPKSREASIKYLITGSVASAILLMGFAYMYGITGSVSISLISDYFYNTNYDALYVFSSLLIIIGLMFKTGCLPFNNWIPDIYEGANYQVGTFISIIPKIAVFAFLARFSVYIFSFSPELKLILCIIALFSVLYGALGAIKQTNIKRIYAYSSIMHSGFLLFCISLLSVYSLSAFVFYLFTYIIMNIGAWAASIIYNDYTNSDLINDYKGAIKNRPYCSIAYIICLLGLAGLPITSGFFAKLYLFSAAIRSGFLFVILLVPLMLFAIIGLFFYFKIIGNLFDKSPSEYIYERKPILSKITLYFSAFITLIICMMPDKLIELSEIIAYYI